MPKIMIVAGLGSSLLRFRGDLITSWLDQGYQVVAAAPGSEVAKQLKQLKVDYNMIPLNRTSINPLKDISLFYSLISLIKTEKPDYLFFYTVKPVIYGSLAALFYRQAEVVSMISGLGYAFTESNGWRKVLQLLVTSLYRLALSRNKLIFFQNPDDQNYFVKKKIVSRRKAVRVNGSGVNIDHFSDTPFPEGPVSFLLIARMLIEKGIAEYIEAARIIKNKYPDIIFRMVGWAFDDNPSAIEQKKVEVWQKEGIVEIFGETDDVRPFIAEAGVYVLPSYREGTPRTVLEAMAMGRAIITSDAPGCRETVVEGANGFLVPIKNSIALAEAMEKFILEPELIRKMGVESRKIAEEKYDVHKVNEIINRAMGLI